MEKIKYEISASFYEDAYYLSLAKIVQKAACDPENCSKSRLHSWKLFRKPPVISKIFPKATYFMIITLADFPASTEGRGDSEENCLVTEGNYEEHFNKHLQNKEVNYLEAKINT